ncbi:MAG: hypothetical protein JWO30_3293 [Fibrobacteres bacterium]|nr:hypothetical protein [Fibrobacterota bacterium]
MHEKDLSLLARILPHMFARWRLPRDFEILAEHPDGRILIDALAGAAIHETAGTLDLTIARELKAGLDSQLEQRGIARDTLWEATVAIVVDTSRVKTDRNNIVHFDFRITSRIRAESGTYEGAQDEEHVWHSRAEGAEE